MILLFEKATISATSVAADSSGLNLDFWIIPAANLITISATQDKIILYFRDGNPYSETLATGEALTGSFRFSTVTFNVTTGKEAEVAKNFYKFILAGPKPIVPIPSVRQIFTFSNVTNEFADIADITSIDTIKRYTTYDTITGTGSSGGLPIGGDLDQVLTKLSSVDGDVDWVYPHTLFLTVRNVSGGTLPKGTPVHATGVTGTVPDVIAADAAIPSAMPATYVLNQSIANNAQGIAIIVGTITGVDTSSFSAGDVVFVAAGGGFTNVKPTGTNLIQNLGVVTKSNVSTGSGVIYGSGRSNDVPNLPTGKFFIGSATNTTQSAYTLPTADGTTGQILTTDGAGAVTFEDAPKGKFSFVISYRYYLATANYYIGNSTYGINNNPTYAIASTASCTNVDAFNGGIVLPFKLSNVGFKVYGYSSGNTRTVSFDLLKGTLPASGGLKTDSISLTTVASNSGFSMTSSTEMYEISATSTNTVDPGDFLLIAFSGSTSSYYYFTITIYGDT